MTHSRAMTRYRRVPTTRAGALASVDRELVGERATALGRAGERLEDAIAAWRRLTADDGATDDDVEEAVEEIAAALYALLVQRDCAGFRINNRRWIRRCYDVPEAALRRV